MADLRYDRELKDVAYLAPGREEKLDLYLPAVAAGTRAPAVVWIHGGGWTSGDKASSREQNVGRNLASAGYVVASVNYRMGAGAWPQNLLDCKNAVRFLRAHATDYGVDPARIAVAGGSAGGHLALMVGLTAGKEWESDSAYPGVSGAVAAIIDFYGITDLLTRRKTDEHGQPSGGFNDGDAPRVFGGSRPGDVSAWRLGSPVNHVTADSPPILIVHGDRDSTVDIGQSRELAEILAERKVPHSLVVVKDAGHTFDLETWKGKPLSLDLRAVVLGFLNERLKPGVR